MTRKRRCRAAVELDRILEEGGPVAEAIRRQFHRTILSRARHGHRKVSGPSMVLLSKLTEGRIAESDWYQKPVRG